MTKLNVAVFFGGRSAEHPISIQSARNVFENLDTKKYTIFLIGIDQNGTWYHITQIAEFLKPTSSLHFSNIGEPVMLVCRQDTPELLFIEQGRSLSKLDMGFPVLHGPYGEDGSFQGLLKCQNLPFVGCDVLASAIAMDKVMTKKLLLSAGLPIGKFVEVSADKDSIHYYKNSQILESIHQLGQPVFVKPANMGSSIGIHKVLDPELLDQAIEKAFVYDHKVIVEQNISGRELEVAILGNADPKVSVPGEIVPRHNFYSYEAKYLDPQGALLQIADLKLSPHTVRRIQELGKQVFLLLGCKGMARVDFFLKDTEELVINEVNTIPGFTHISMYPKLWEASGLPYPDLLDQLIQLAQSSSLARKK